MTMSFRIEDHGALTDIKDCQAVDFRFKDAGNGEYVITRFQPRD